MLTPLSAGCDRANVKAVDHRGLFFPPAEHVQSILNPEIIFYSSLYLTFQLKISVVCHHVTASSASVEPHSVSVSEKG